MNRLYIRAPATKIAKLLAALDKSLSDGWRADKDAEARLRKLGLSTEGTRCFRCTQDGMRSSAALWLQKRGEEELHVTNIVALGKRELSCDEYNIILGDFESRVLGPATDDVRGDDIIETVLEHGRITPEAYLSPEAARRLRAFTATEHKCVLDPNDRQRWREFLIQVHVDGVYFDPLLLDQWFIDRGWPEEERRELVSEYESARLILTTYDEERLEKCLP